MFLSENLIHPRGCFLSLDLFAFPLMEVPQKSQTIKFIQYYDCKQFKIIVITATTTLEADEMKVFVAAIDARFFFTPFKRLQFVIEPLYDASRRYVFLSPS